MSEPIFKQHFKTLKLCLAGEGKNKMDLSFCIQPTKLAQRWAFLLQQDLPFGIREKDRFTNFYKDPQKEIDKGIRKILFLIEKLKPLHPEIHFGTIDFSNVQKEINRLHVHFADKQIAKKDLCEQSFQYWNDLNVVLHQIERCLCDLPLKARPNTNNKGSADKKTSYRIPPGVFPRGSLTVTFYNQNKEELLDTDFKDMVLNQTFGCVYLNYAQVGRHIMELWWSQDETLPVEHVQPFQKLSSDFFVYFGPSLGHSDHLLILEKIKNWFLKREEYFSKLNLFWDPIKLHLGFLPLAFLSPVCWSIEEAKTLREKISRFHKIESVSLN